MQRFPVENEFAFQFLKEKVCAVKLQGMILHEERFFDMEAKGNSGMSDDNLECNLMIL